MINHQGLVKVNGEPFGGAGGASGQFKFGFIDSDGNWLWTNDGSRIGQSASATTPVQAIVLNVVFGVYSVPLGDPAIPNMVEIPSSVFDSDDVDLRVIFNNGVHGEQTLLPDQRMSSGAYAYHAATVDQVPADIALISYRHNCRILHDTASTVRLLPGEIAIPNANRSLVRYRRNDDPITVTWADLDTGSESADTLYYLYAVSDEPGDDFTAELSASEVGPLGATFFRMIGFCYNNVVGDLTGVGNVKAGGIGVYQKLIGSTYDFQNIPEGWGVIGAVTQDMQTHFLISEGDSGVVRVTFTAPMRAHAGESGSNATIRFIVDGTPVKTGENTPLPAAAPAVEVSLVWEGQLVPGVHSIQVEWQGYYMAQPGDTDGPRILTIEEPF